jgi:predicted dehydrogenase
MWNVENIAPNGFGNPPDGDPPADLDWEFWLGPAPKVQYNPNRFNRHYWFWEYGGGWPSEWGVHLHDVTHWAMKVDQPLSAVASGGKFVRKDNCVLPDTFEAVFEYPGFITMYSFRHGNGRPVDGMDYGSAFYGENGTLIINRQSWRILPEKNEAGKFRMEAKEGPGTSEIPEHQQAFLDAVKAHKISDASDVEIGHHSSLPGHLSNISFRVGHKVYWDAEKGNIKDDPEASKLLVPEYRAPWKLEIV